MTEHPLVSIIIPTVGRPKYLPDAVASALAQDYPALEVLVSDNKPQIPCRAFLLPEHLARVRLVERAERVEIAAHFNTILSEARGEYILILSDDDMLEDGYVTAAMAPLLAGKAIASLGQQVAIGKNFQRSDITPMSPGPTQILSTTEFFDSWLRHTRRFAMSTYLCALARKSDYEALGGFAPYPDASQSDNTSMIGLACRGNVAIVRKAYLYRLYEQSGGLSTPFDWLLKATAMFLRDATALINATSRLNQSEKAHVCLLLRLRASSMMIRRLFQIYRKRLSLAQLTWAFGQVISTALGSTVWADREISKKS